MRPVDAPGYQLIPAVLVALAGAGGGAYLASAVRLPLGVTIGAIAAVAGVLLARAPQPRLECVSCKQGEPLDAAEEAAFRETDRSQLRETLRGQLATELRPAIEREVGASLQARVRADVERELRPRLADELRAQVAAELRPQIEAELTPRLVEALRPGVAAQLRPALVAELKPELEREAEARVRAEYERRIAERARTQQAAEAARPVAAAGPAVVAPARTAAPASAPAPAAVARAAGVVESPLASGTSTSAADPHARAQRRARVILSDIALYHRDLVENAARSREPQAVLGAIWGEAVRSYNEAVPDEIRGANYLDQALDALIQKVRRELNIG